MKVSLRMSVLWIIVILGIYVRGAGLVTHFTSEDDIGIARNILKYRYYVRVDPAEFREIIRDRDQWQGASNVSYKVAERLESMVGTDFLRKLDSWGALDLLLGGLNAVGPVVAVPSLTTFAPLQFCITAFLIWEGQTYLEKIFWGRLPSFLFGVLGLLMFIGVYRKYELKDSGHVFLGLTLLAFSWENIIFANHMSCYSLGVFASVLILYLLLVNAEKERLSGRMMLVNGLCLAVLCTTQYQALFFILGFFLALFFCFVRKRQKILSILRNMFLGAAVLIAGLIPMYLLFLKMKVDRGTGWNVGPSQEFYFPRDGDYDLWEQITYAAGFFLKNTALQISSMTAVIPRESSFYLPVSIFFLILFAAGWIGLFRSRNLKKQILGVFFLGVVFTWFVLIVKGKITLSPTRHSLVLLPILCLIMAEGLGYGFSKVQAWRGAHVWNRYGHLTVSTVIIALFFMYFGGVMHERRNPIDEKEVVSLLKSHHVDTVIAYGFTLDLSLMDEVMDHYNYYEEMTPRIRLEYQEDKKGPFYETIAFVSAHEKMEESTFYRLVEKINAVAKPGYHIPWRYDDYEVVYAKEIESDVDVEFTHKMSSTLNSYYFYILKRMREVVREF